MQETFGPLLSEVCCVFPLAEVGFSEVDISGAGNAPPPRLGVRWVLCGHRATAGIIRRAATCLPLLLIPLPHLRLRLRATDLK